MQGTPVSINSPIERAAGSVGRPETLAAAPLCAGCAVPPLGSLPSVSVVYDDADLLVVEKPAGMVVHPACGHVGDTLLDALAAYRSAASSGAAAPLRPVHRLDKDTSGLLVLARTARAHRYLAYQWQHQTVVRGYLALVAGLVEPAEGVIELPLARDPGNRQRVRPTPDGQPARTVYMTAGRYAGHSLLDVRIETGRMHQIRVHLASLGHPIVGDTWYGLGATLPGVTRQFLHAHLLVVLLPSTRQFRTFRSALPSDLAGVLAALRADAGEIGLTRAHSARVNPISPHSSGVWHSHTPLE